LKKDYRLERYSFSFNYKNPERSRKNLRQGALDVLNGIGMKKGRAVFKRKRPSTGAWAFFLMGRAE
jgi:hypothetical protein